MPAPCRAVDEGACGSASAGRRLVALVLLAAFCCGAAPALAAGEAAAPPAETSATRLERIRNALIDEALQSPVRVSSSAWVDESGQYRQVTRLYSDLRRRALKELDGDEERPAAHGGNPAAVQPARQSPQTGTAQSAATGASAPHPSAIPSTAPVATSPASSTAPALPQQAGVAPVATADPPKTPPSSCPRRMDGLRREAWVAVTARAHDGGHGQAFLMEVAQRTREELEARARESGGLRLIAIDAFPRNSYEYRLANNGLFDTPHLIEIALSSSGAADLSLRPGEATGPRTLLAVLSLIERVGDRPLIRRAYSVPVPGAVPVVGNMGLAPEVLAALQALAADWWRAMQEVAACAPLRVQVVPESSTLLAIPVGSGAGVRLGDRWVVGDASRIPSRVLEQGSLEGVRLAEVVSVSLHRSTLRLESSQGSPGKAAASDRGLSWFASPL